MQEMAWYLTIIFVGLISLTFIYVAVRSRHAADYSVVQPAAYRRRAQLFWGLVVAGIVIAAATLRDLPYAYSGDAPQVVTAQAYQWYWELGRDSVVAGTPVEFQISSADVNHGFGIYDPDARLVAQAQAMPGYVNRLRYTFTRPGKYQLLCLEYCGVAHHEMIAELEVTAPE